MRNENRFYTYKGHKDWLFNQWNKYCREVAYPLVMEYRNAGQKPRPRRRLAIDIPIIPYMGSTTLAWIQEFGWHKQMTVTDQIGYNMIFPPIQTADQIRAIKILLALDK